MKLQVFVGDSEPLEYYRVALPDFEAVKAIQYVLQVRGYRFVIHNGSSIALLPGTNLYHFVAYRGEPIRDLNIGA